MKKLVLVLLLSGSLLTIPAHATGDKSCACMPRSPFARLCFWFCLPWGPTDFQNENKPEEVPTQTISSPPLPPLPLSEILRLERRSNVGLGPIQGAAFSLQNKIGVLASTPSAHMGIISVWNLETGTLIRSWPQTTLGEREPGKDRTGMTAIALSNDATLALGASRDRNVTLWEVQTKSIIQIFKNPTAAMTSLAITPDQKYAIGGSQAGVLVWDLKSGETVLNIHLETTAITVGGDILLIGGHDGTLQLWNLQKLSLQTVFPPHHQAKITSISLSKNGQTALTADEQGKVYLWDTQTGVAKKDLALSLESSAVLPPTKPMNLRSSGSLVRGSQDGYSSSISESLSPPHILLAKSPSADLRTRAVRASTLKSDGLVVSAAALSSQGNYALLGVSDSENEAYEIYLWNSETDELRRFLGEGHSKKVTMVGFSEDDQTGFSSSNDGTARLWKLDIPQVDPAEDTGALGLM